MMPIPWIISVVELKRGSGRGCGGGTLLLLALISTAVGTVPGTTRTRFVQRPFGPDLTRWWTRPVQLDGDAGSFPGPRVAATAVSVSFFVDDGGSGGLRLRGGEDGEGGNSEKVEGQGSTAEEDAIDTVRHTFDTHTSVMNGFAPA